MERCWNNQETSHAGWGLSLWIPVTFFPAHCSCFSATKRFLSASGMTSQNSCSASSFVKSPESVFLRFSDAVTIFFAVAMPLLDAADPPPPSGGGTVLSDLLRVSRVRVSRVGVGWGGVWVTSRPYPSIMSVLCLFNVYVKFKGFGHTGKFWRTFLRIIIQNIHNIIRIEILPTCFDFPIVRRFFSHHFQGYFDGLSVALVVFVVFIDGFEHKASVSTSKDKQMGWGCVSGVCVSAKLYQKRKSV